MREEILETYAALRRRRRWLRGFDVFLEAAFVMTLTIAAMLLVDRLAFELGWARPHLAAWALPLMGGALALAFGLAAGAAFLRREGPAELARIADRAVHGEERFLSALELAASGAEGGFVPLVLRDAAALPVEPKRILRRPPVGYRAAILLSLVAAGVLHAYPPQIAPAPGAGFRATPERGAAPLEVSFESLHQGAVDEIRWTFGDGATGDGLDPTHVYEQPGTFTVIQEVRGPGGSAKFERTIEVLPKNHAVAAFEAEPVKGRAPLTVRFRNHSENAERYEWDFGDGSKSPDPEPKHVYAKPGLYTVRLTAIGPAGTDTCERGRYVKVVGEDAPLADFRAHPRKGPAPLQVGFEDLSTGKIESWEWDFGDLTAGQERFSQETNPGHVFRFPGRYTVLLRVKGPGGEDEETKVAYIVVEDDGSGKGGRLGGGSQSGGGGKAGSQSGGAGKDKGRLFGDKTPERKIEIDPDLVTADPRDGDKTVRERKIYSSGDGESKDPTERKVADVFSHYERAAEKTMSRERIPPPVRDYVKRYLEDIRPK